MRTRRLHSTGVVNPEGGLIVHAAAAIPLKAADPTETLEPDAETLFAEFSADFGDTPLNWDARFEALAWRLHPESATAAWTARAMAPELDEAARRRALDALAFTPGRAAAAPRWPRPGKARPGRRWARCAMLQPVDALLRHFDETPVLRRPVASASALGGEALAPRTSREGK